MHYKIERAIARPMAGILPREGRYPVAIHDLAEDALFIVERAEDDPQCEVGIDDHTLSMLIAFALLLEAEALAYLVSKLIAVEINGEVRAFQYSDDPNRRFDGDDTAKLRPMSREEAFRFMRYDNDISGPYDGWNHEKNEPSWIGRLPAHYSWVRDKHLLAAYALWSLEQACLCIDEGRFVDSVELVGIAGSAVATARYVIGWDAACYEAPTGSAQVAPGNEVIAHADLRALGRLGGLKKGQRLARAKRFVIDKYTSRSDWKSTSDFARIVRNEVIQISRDDGQPLSEINAERTIREWVRSSAGG